MYCLCHVLLLQRFNLSSSVGLLFCDQTYVVGPPFPNTGGFFVQNGRFNSTCSLILRAVMLLIPFIVTLDSEGTSRMRRRLQAGSSARVRLALPNTRGSVAQTCCFGGAPGTQPLWGPPSDGYPPASHLSPAFWPRPPRRQLINKGWVHPPASPQR